MRSKPVRRGRSEEEKVADLLLLLYLIWDSQKRGYAILGETKLQKLVFLAERRMLGKKYKGFNYNFIRLDFGPYSWELKRDLNLLLESGIVIDDPSEGLIVSRKGEKILKEILSILERNREFINIIEEVNKECAKLDLKELLERVYSMKRPLKGPKITIREVKHRSPLLRRIRKEHATKTFLLTEEEQLITKILFDTSLETWEYYKVKDYKVLVFRLKGEDFYSVVVPELLGCCSQGRTVDEALMNIKEAIELYCEEKVHV